MARMLLILDLDETLIYASETPLARSADFQVGPYHVYRRPFLDTFLATVRQWYDLAIWTSAGEGYAATVIRSILPDACSLAFVWSATRCTSRFDPELQERYHLKDLRKVKRLGFPLEHVLMLDDSPEKLQRHYGNHLRVTPFYGNADDTELHDMLPFLNYLRTVENVRVIEKRTWRDWRRPPPP